MRTAIDANVISSIWSGEEPAGRLATLIVDANDEGGLVISAPVYAELLAYPNATRTALDRFLRESDVRADFDLSVELWVLAGEAFASYSDRRRKSGGGLPKRLLVDFVVGAHALTRADRLMTLDKSRYATAFPDLQLIG